MFNEACNEKLDLSANFKWEGYRQIAEFIDAEMEADLRFYTGVTKRGFYNYILFDGGKLKLVLEWFKDAERRGIKLTDIERISATVSCIFYVGKGRADRALQHLKEAHDSTNKNEKVGEIRAIWNKNQGIIIHQFFNYSTSFEASTREAILIDFIGKEHLSNERKGTFYGSLGKWGGPKLHNMGFYYTLLVLERLTLQKHNVFLKYDIV